MRIRKLPEAYIEGLEQLVNKGVNIRLVNSVASFFVSRLDTAVDKELDKIGNKELKGKIAIANAKKAYQFYKEIFGTNRWKELEKKGAKKQRLLWASTSSKNPDYYDNLYLDNLIGKNTVNTVPPATLKSFLDHGISEPTLEKDLETSNSQLNKLKKLGISLDKITAKLLDEGIESFSASFNLMMKAIKDKTIMLKGTKEKFSFSIVNYQKDYDNKLEQLNNENIIERIWKNDFTVWSNKPDEITNRLGWLNSPGASLGAIEEINEFVNSVRQDGIRHVLLLGMGGSSLAPEVFSKVFGAKKDYPDLAVLDSTEPGAVLEYSGKLKPAETLYIVSSKSGGTVETFSFMKYFYNQTVSAVGKENGGKHFAVITDPGSGLQAVAKELKFRKIFLNDPEIGGRYSALSFFGIVPAALIGVDIKELLMRVADSLVNHKLSIVNASAAKIGVIMGMLAKAGKDKITFITSDELSSFSSWVEQLIAESTGKLGKGILPVDGETILKPEYYANDRLFVYIRLAKDKQLTTDPLRPYIELTLNDIYDLGAEFFRWEMATAIAGWMLNIQPFDQPNVESAKILAREMVEEYKHSGKLPEMKASFADNDLKIYGDYKGSSVKDILDSFLNTYSTGDKEGKGRSYICIQTYLKPEDNTTQALQTLRTRLQKKLKSATTLGYGPRFLHSTGQLHKGDAGKGLFIQFIAQAQEDIPIPDNPGDNKSSMTFGILIKAQASGDRQALLDSHRNVITIDLGKDTIGNLKMIEDLI